jgi:hypothetical protein
MRYDSLIPKDVAILRLLLATARLDLQVLRERLESTPMREVEIVRVHALLDAVAGG